jgi:hypothetical protein
MDLVKTDTYVALMRYGYNDKNCRLVQILNNGLAIPLWADQF